MLGLFVCASDFGYSEGLILAAYAPLNNEKVELETTQAGLLETDFRNATLNL